jgi:octaprenyl-diphosphate synthase
MFGNAASVLVGDFLYSRAFQMMVSVDRMRVLEVLAEATNVIAEGEVLQLMNVHDPDITVESTCASSVTRPPSCSRPVRAWAP